MSRRHFVVAPVTAAVVAGCAYGQLAVSVADTLTAQARLSTLNSSATKAGLTGTFKASGLFSIFALTHDPFAKMSAKTTETLARLFDEAPVALSLAGLIAVRYTFEVLNALDGRLIG